jgi:nicotinamidase-related amidase
MRSIYVIAGFIVVFLFPIVHSVAQGEANSLDNKIVIVVHMQNAYSKNELSEKSTSDEIAEINQIITDVDPENVVYLKAMHKVLNLTLKKIYVEEIVKDLDGRLKIVNENNFIDHGGDIFTSKELIKFLKDKNINQIVIVGRVANECIKTSTLSGLKIGYDMYLVSDAIVGKSEKCKQKSIRKLVSKGAKELTIN